MNFGKERMLVISPHPDDEVLGCCGLINRIKDNGGEVYVQILTMGGYLKSAGGRVTREAWKNEFLKTAKFLKIDGYDIAFYTKKFKYLDTIPENELINILEFKSKVSISKIKPTIVAIPTVFSTHQDHIYTYTTAITALRPHPQRSSHMPKLVISYEAPEYYFWSAYSEFGRFLPNFYLQMSKKDIDRKVAALNLYKSQLREGQRDATRITLLSSIRGSEIGVSFAEGYHVHRFQL